VADLYPAPGAAIRDPSVEVRGRLLDPKIAAVLVNGVPVDREGDRFSVRIATAPEIALGFRNAQGAEVGGGVLRLVIDRDPPVVAIDGGAEQYHTTEPITLAGTVTDRTSDGRVGVAYALRDDRFAISVTLADGAARTLRLEARDRAGHTTAVDLRLVHDDAPPKVHLDAPAAPRTATATHPASAPATSASAP
jgi:hypothetical protein